MEIAAIVKPRRMYLAINVMSDVAIRIDYNDDLYSLGYGGELDYSAAITC